MSELDQLLDEALDDFEEVEEQKPNLEDQQQNKGGNSSSLSFNPLPARKSKKESSGENGSKGAQEGGQLGDDQETDKMLGQLTDALQQIFKDVDKGSGSQKPEIDATVAALAQETSTLKKEDGPSLLDPDNPPPFMQDLVNEIMKHIVAKDVLYQPMKEIGLRYPAWLEENQASLSPEELTKYRRQFKLIQDIVEVYEKDPENYDKLMVILEEMHSLGSPPQAIIDAVAPGVNTNGLEMLSDPSLFPGSGISAT